MFPLGSVLLPGTPLPLRVFEPRHVALLSAMLGESDREFGVVLIERGSEAGGGDARIRFGTVASIVTVEIGEGSIVLVVRDTLTRHSAFVDLSWPADVRLSDDRAERLWQLAGIAPIGSPGPPGAAGLGHRRGADRPPRGGDARRR